MQNEATGFEALSEMDLLDFFGVDPVECEPADGYWAYEVADARGMMLRFSFNVHERSVQTVLSFSGKSVSIVSYEGAVRMWLDKGVLRCEFRAGGSKASVSIEAGEAIRVDWATLRTES